MAGIGMALRRCRRGYLLPALIGMCALAIAPASAQPTVAEFESYKARIEAAVSAVGDHPRLRALPPKKREELAEFVSGNLLFTLLHELAHAAINQFDLPVLGKEEDAADQIAGFITLQFGKEVARTAINGAAFAWITLASESSKPLFYDVHSTPQQRVYTFACLGYGGYPDTFKDYVETGLLPKARAANCKREYEQAKLAFTTTILPYIDLDKMKQVQARTWDLSADGK